MKRWQLCPVGTAQKGAGKDYGSGGIPMYKTQNGARALAPTAFNDLGTLINPFSFHMKEVLVCFVNWSTVLHKPSVGMPEAGEGASSSKMGVAAKYCPVQALPLSLQAWNNSPVSMWCPLQALPKSLLPDRKMKTWSKTNWASKYSLTLEILLKVRII